MYFLPKFITASTAEGLLNLHNSMRTDKNDHLDCDAKNLQFVDPFGLCVLSSMCHQLHRQHKSVEIHNIPDSISSYLSRMDLFGNCHINVTNINQRNDQRNALVEVKRLENLSEIGVACGEIANAIVGTIPDIDFNASADEMTGYKPFEQITVPLQYIFSELLENSLTHGRKHGFNDACVWVASQYFPSNDLIRLAVVDDGCGYLTSLNNHRSLISNSHISAIKAALVPEVSCNRDLDLMEDSANMGIGLTVANDLVQTAGGKTTIVSGDAILRIENSADSGRNIASWQGVLISLELTREMINNIKLQDVISKYQPSTSGPSLTFE